jgi:hypothetical protein
LRWLRGVVQQLDSALATEQPKRQRAANRAHLQRTW